MAPSPPSVRSLRALVGKDHSTLVKVWDARAAATPEATALIWKGPRAFAEKRKPVFKRDR